jgi:hypothetical protein
MRDEVETGIYHVESPNLEIDGTITVVLTNGKHFTYRLETVRRGSLEGKRIVSLLVGPDNSRSYKGFGFLNKDEREDSTTHGMTFIHVWRKCNTEAFNKHAAILCGMADEHVDKFLQSGKCLKCGRKLTTPESITAGIGPVCAGRGV